MSDPGSDFFELVSKIQTRLYTFIASAVFDSDSAEDVLQETNLVMLRKWSDFRIGSNFDAWAYQIARFQIMAFRQKKDRDKLLFGDDLIDRIMAWSQEYCELQNTQMKDLDRCIESLPPRSRQVIRRRYYDGDSVQKIADEMKLNQNAVSQLLFRVRKALVDCVTHRKAVEENDAV